MKYLLLFLVTLPGLAQTYRVESRGHHYTYETNSKRASLKSKHHAFQLEAKPCSNRLINDLQKYFKKQLRFQTKGTENVIRVNDGKSTVHIPQGHPGGQNLALFPDYFAEKYLVYKELCK